MKTLATLFFFLLTGCCPSQQLSIRDRDIAIPVPPMVEQGIPVEYGDEFISQDTTHRFRFWSPVQDDQTPYRPPSFTAVKTVGKDTTIKVTYNAAKHTVDVKAQPGPVHYEDIDTTRTIKPTVIETPFLAKVGIFALGLCAGVIITLAAVVLLKR